jgi:hypothetical protein
MPKRTIVLDGRRWSVALSGRRTQYTRDEYGLVFTSLDGPGEQRLARFSPLDTKNAEGALAGLSEAQLQAYLRQSQPGWTSPELGYRR